MPWFVWACPVCATPLPSTLHCSGCGRNYSYRDGIYRFLLPERQAALQPFMSQYRLIRKSDGYRSQAAAYYRSLPHTDPVDPQAQTWRVRAQTFAHLLQQVLGYSGPSLANTQTAWRESGHRGAGTQQSDGASGRNRASLAVLDLGAGNGWLSQRLAALGHHCVAVDFIDDAQDGLGAFVHYDVSFTCVQADFDQLPFAAHQFDIVIFNASLHYSPDIPATLRHAHSMLLPRGTLVVMDSPTFRSAASGQLMLLEQAARLRAQSSMAQIQAPGVGFLSAEAIIQAGRQLGVEFRFSPSRGSVRWALGRLLAGYQRGREPASFGLWYGRT